MLGRMPQGRGNSQLGRWLLWGPAGLTILTLALGQSSSSAASGHQTDRCRSTTIVDYAEPLDRLSSRRRPPRSGKLPFAPGGQKISVIGQGALAGSHPIGFGLDFARKDEAASFVTVPWTIHATLLLVSRSGRVVKALRSRQWTQGRRSAQEVAEGLVFRVGRPAFYRVDVDFSDRWGRQIKEYSEYFRVLTRRVDVAVNLVQQHLRPGEIVESVVENRGTTLLEFGEEFAIDRYVDGAWRRDALSPPGFIQVGYLIFGGTGYACRTIRLPADVEPGHYRFTKPVDVVGGSKRWLSADFYVSR